jgi:hypothetical protein
MITDYPGYEDYEHAIRHADHHGGGIELDYDGVHELAETISSLRARAESAKKLVEALEAIKAHHISLNQKAGRSVLRSRTLKMCEDALNVYYAVNPPTQTNEEKTI